MKIMKLVGKFDYKTHFSTQKKSHMSLLQTGGTKEDLLSSVHWSTSNIGRDAIAIFARSNYSVGARAV